MPPYIGRAKHARRRRSSRIRESPVLADFVAEVGFEGRVGRPEDILGRGEAIVLRQPRAEREL
jgi:hypothetical protein